MNTSESSNGASPLKQVKKPTLYLVISIIATAIDVGFLIIGVEIFGMYYLVAATTSYLISLVTKFIMNKFLVFQERPGTWVQQFTRFSVVSINGLILTNIFLYVGVDLLYQTYLLSKAVTVFIVFFYTATLHNYVSFGNKKSN